MDALMTLVNAMGLADLKGARKQEIFKPVLPQIEGRILELSAKPKYQYRVTVLESGMLKLPKAIGRESWEAMRDAIDAEFAKADSKWTTYQEAHGQ